MSTETEQIRFHQFLIRQEPGYFDEGEMHHRAHRTRALTLKTAPIQRRIQTPACARSAGCRKIRFRCPGRYGGRPLQ